MTGDDDDVWYDYDEYHVYDDDDEDEDYNWKQSGLDCVRLLKNIIIRIWTQFIAKPNRYLMSLVLNLLYHSQICNIVHCAVEFNLPVEHIEHMSLYEIL